MKPLKAYNFLAEYTSSPKMSEAVKPVGGAKYLDNLVNDIEDVAILGVIGLAGFLIYESRYIIGDIFEGAAAIVDTAEDTIGIESDPCDVSKYAREHWWYGLINPVGSTISAIRCNKNYDYYIDEAENERLFNDIQKAHWQKIERDASIIAATNIAGFVFRKEIGNVGKMINLLSTVYLVSDIVSEFKKTGKNYTLDPYGTEIEQGNEIEALNDIKGYIIEDLNSDDKVKFEQDSALLRDYVLTYRKLIDRPDIRAWLNANPYIESSSLENQNKSEPQMYEDFLVARTPKWLKGEVKLEPLAQEWFEQYHRSLVGGIDI